MKRKEVEGTREVLNTTPRVSTAALLASNPQLFISITEIRETKIASTKLIK